MMRSRWKLIKTRNALKAYRVFPDESSSNGKDFGILR